MDCLCCFASLCISAPASHSQGQWRPRSRLKRGREMRYIKERLLLFCFIFVFGLGTQSNSLHSKCVWGPKLLDLSSWSRAGAQRCSTESSGSQIANQKSACVSLAAEASPGGLLMNQGALRCRPRTQDRLPRTSDHQQGRGQGRCRQACAGSPLRPGRAHGKRHRARV